MKKTNIRDVAREAGTSISSVSRCLNDAPGVASSVRQRITAAVQRLGYDIRTGKRRVIALIMPTIQIPSLGLYSPMVIDCIRKKVAQQGYGCLMVSREDIGLLSENQISGAVSFDYLKEVGYKFPNMKNIPLVCFNDIGNHLEQVYSVHSNEENGIAQAINFLHQNHHTKIGFFYFQESRNMTSHLRFDAFLKITEELGIRNSCMTQSFSQDLPLHEAMGMLLERKCTAIIVSGEDTAPAVARALSVFGKRIPEDISLITYESSFSCLYTPRHTTIAQNFSALADASIDLLEKMIHGEKNLGDRKIDYTLKIRESVRDLFQK